MKDSATPTPFRRRRCGLFAVVRRGTGLAAAAMTALTTVLPPVAVEAEGASTPFPRFDSAMAAEPVAGGKLLLFGGRYQTFNGTQNAIDETWTWDGAKWKMHLPAKSPTRRYNLGMASDKTTGTVVAFGGLGIVSGTSELEHNDTWLWDPETRQWSDVSPLLSPPPTAAPVMAYDAVSKRVLLVRAGTAGLPTETWTWDGDARTWIRESSPTPPDGGSMAYDAVNRQVVYLGRGQTWTWNGLTRSWTQRFPDTGPDEGTNSIRTGLAYDVKRKKVVAPLRGAGFDQTWTWSGTTWTLEAPLQSPPGRARMVAAYHAGTGAVYIFGGSRDNPNGRPTLFGDTWSWNGTNWKPRSGTLPLVSVGDVSIHEGDDGNKIARFTVSLSKPTSGPVHVQYATGTGTATATDFNVVNSGGVALGGDNLGTVNVSVHVIGDTSEEGNETFNVKLSSPWGALIGDGMGVGTILDDEATNVIGRRLAIGDVSVHEGNAGARSAFFPVTLSEPSADTVSVSVFTAKGTALGSDFTMTSKTISFRPGTTGLEVVVPITPDTLAEGDEVFTVKLSGASGATISDGTGVGTIVDDD